MSQQTGAQPPSGPASQRLGDRARFRFQRAWATPNPIFVREMRQTARLTRTPIGLALVTAGTTLVLALVGVLVQQSRGGAFTGYVAHQIFFGAAYFVVTLFGPVLAANVIAAEREGRTWEALQLTGLGPGTIARGKFAAAYVSLATYIVGLAPVSALVFLFGGVSPLEVALGFLFLLVMGGFSVATGLAVSSKLESGRVAMAVTFLIGAPVSVIAFTAFGVGGSYLAHELWPQVEAGPPIWYPTACVVAPFDARFVGVLVVGPLLALALPAWFLHEATVAALGPEGGDGTFGVKRWYLATSAVAALAGTTPAFGSGPGGNRIAMTIGVLASLFGAFAGLLFQGEPPIVPRRLRHRWAQERPSLFRRLWRPEAARSGVVVALVGALPIAVALAAVEVGEVLHGRRGGEAQARWILGYCLGFQVAAAGTAALVRTLSRTAGAARGGFAAGLTLLSFGPWIVAGVAMLVFDGSWSDWMWVAAPAPTYVFSDAWRRAPLSGWAMSAVWGAIGAVALAVATRRARAATEEEVSRFAEVERRLEEEDVARAAALEAHRVAEASSGSPADPEGEDVSKGDHSAPPEGER